MDSTAGNQLPTQEENLCSASSNSTPNNTDVIPPAVQNIPKCESWREVIVDCNKGCPEKNLYNPIKDWKMEARNSTSKVTSNCSDRKRVADLYEVLR